MLKMDDNQHFSKSFIYSIWFLMAFQAGYVNIGGLYISGNFVSHVTGTSSRIGKGIAELDLYSLITFPTILLSFVIGAAFAGHYIGALKELGQRPKYILVTAVKAIFFGMAFFLLAYEDLLIIMLNISAEILDMLIIFLLSFSCGVQNATCSLSTNGFLKPTHMTGLSTDIGINLSRLKSLTGRARKLEWHKSKLRLSILASFIFGGVISTFVFEENGHQGLLFPFLSSLCFLLVSILGHINISPVRLVYKGAVTSIYATFVATLMIGMNII